MTYLDPRTGTLNAKIVYYGLPSAGRSTNLLHIYDRVRPEDKSRLIRIATYEHHEQLFFDFLARSLSASLGRPLPAPLTRSTPRASGPAPPRPPRTRRRSGSSRTPRR